jgi:hypothetical protein
VLAYIEHYRGVVKGDKVLQLAFGSGFKCNSAVWVANKSFKEQCYAWEVGPACYVVFSYWLCCCSVMAVGCNQSRCVALHYGFGSGQQLLYVPHMALADIRVSLYSPAAAAAAAFQGFDLQAMYEDLSTLEIKLNQLLEKIGRKPMSPSPTPGAKPAAAADALPAIKAVAAR